MITNYHKFGLMANSTPPLRIRNNVLDLLRFPLAVMVIFTHAFPSTISIVHDSIDLSLHHFYELIKNFLIAFNDGYSVPVFFFISGYFFFKGVDFTPKVYVEKLRKRMRTLLVPYVLWTTLYLAMLLYKFLPCFSGLISDGKEFNFSWMGLLSCYWIYDHSLVVMPEISTIVNHVNSDSFPLLYPLWFLRDLMIVVLCSPLIYWALRHMRHYAVIVLGVVCVALKYWQLGHVGMLLTSFFFFSWGAYISNYKNEIVILIRPYFEFSLIGYIIMGIVCFVSIYYFPHWTMVIRNIGVIFFLLFVINLANILLENGKCDAQPFLASASFFVYVAHPFVLPYVSRILFKVMDPSSGIVLVALYILSAILSIFLLLGVYKIMQNYCRPLLGILTGRG